MAHTRFCAHCDQPVEEIPKAAKEWTPNKSDSDTTRFKHLRTAHQGVSYCGRQFLAEHETYTEGESE